MNTGVRAALGRLDQCILLQFSQAIVVKCGQMTREAEFHSHHITSSGLNDRLIQTIAEVSKLYSGNRLQSGLVDCD